MNAQKLQAAKDLIASGDKIKAQAVLAGVVTETPHDAEAWYLLSESIDDRERKLIYLRRALQLDPTLDAASEQLAQLEAEAETDEEDELKTLFSPVPETAAEEEAAEALDSDVEIEAVEADLAAAGAEMDEDEFSALFEEVDEEDEVDSFSFEELGLEKEEFDELDEDDLETIFTQDDDTADELLDEEDEFDFEELAPDISDSPVETVPDPAGSLAEGDTALETESATAVATSSPPPAPAEEGDSTNLLLAILGALALILAYFFIQSLFALF